MSDKLTSQAEKRETVELLSHGAGMASREYGEPLTANPYKPETKEHVAWSEGWKSLDQKKRRDSALRSIGLGRFLETSNG